MAWLTAIVAWSATDGVPPLEVEGGSPDAAAVPMVSFDASGGSLVVPSGGPELRCHALVFALRVEAISDTAPVAVELAAREAGEWRVSATFEMPGAGTYLGFVALEKKPRTIDAVRISLDGLSGVEVYDLALLAFG
jgi:hypothetical protein